MCTVCLLAAIPLPREAEREENRCVTETKQLCVCVCMCDLRQPPRELANTHTPHAHLNPSDRAAFKDTLSLENRVILSQDVKH